MNDDHADNDFSEKRPSFPAIMGSSKKGENTGRRTEKEPSGGLLL